MEHRSTPRVRLYGRRGLLVRLHARKDGISQETLGRVAHTHVHGEDHKESLEPDVRNVFRCPRPQNRAHEDSYQLRAYKQEVDRCPFTNMNVKMEVTMLTNTAIAEVPATMYIGSPATEVRNGTYRNPPPTPMNAEMAAMAKPPSKGQMGAKENSTP